MTREEMREQAILAALPVCMQMTYDYIKENGEFSNWQPQEVAAAKAIVYDDELVAQLYDGKDIK